MRKIPEIIVVILFSTALYIGGSLVFNYELPEFIEHHKTKQEEQVFIDNMKIPISVKTLKTIMIQRDSLIHVIDSLKQIK